MQQTVFTQISQQQIVNTPIPISTETVGIQANKFMKEDTDACILRTDIHAMLDEFLCIIPENNNVYTGKTIHTFIDLFITKFL
jgi:hypothetical protein